MAEASEVAAAGRVTVAAVKSPVNAPEAERIGRVLRARVPYHDPDEFAARVRPWPDEPGTVQLITVDQSAPPPEVIRSWLDELRSEGVSRVRTGALGPTMRPPYFECGFTVRQELTLLSHDLTDLRTLRTPGALDGGPVLRRGRTGDLVSLALTDRRAFGSMWCMDLQGIVDACTATPNHRLRIAMEGSQVLAYAVSGRAARSAYLQRLAVDPDAQGRGLGRMLTVDALRWARRHRCTTMLVNTHVDNEAALHLYHSVGFVDMPYRLMVLDMALGRDLP
ncbi:MAG: hypothetical protein RL219_73 [Actinomycetota bacterium]